MGEMSIPRADIGEKGIEEAAGTIAITPEPEVVEPAPQEDEWTPENVERLKQQIRAELLRELLDGLIDQKLENKVEELQDIEKRIPGSPYVQLPPERVDAIQQQIRELTRQRTQNRVRAERYLKEMGPDVLPFLEALASHPFDLTRRAVQRVVKEIGDVRGAPISIWSLNDPDEWVRKLAHESLETLLPGAPIRYSASAAERSRLVAQEQYYQLWDAEMRFRIREALLADANIDE
jgi:hypothetical protein